MLMILYGNWQRVYKIILPIIAYAKGKAKETIGFFIIGY
jgi:hypothetical protein